MNIPQIYLTFILTKVEFSKYIPLQIRVSLTADASGKCVRQYKRSLQPSTTNTIVMSYALNTRDKDSLLLYMGSNNNVSIF